MDNNYLAHYGIPRQEWYHRRFQNYDGSLTPEGRIRYGVGEPRETVSNPSSSSSKESSKPSFYERYKKRKEEKRKAAEKSR